MSDAEEPQREITRVALRSLDGTSFVLAGSGAIREHGLVDRPTEDVDLSRFSSVVDAVVLGLREAGHDVAELRRVDQFARLEVTTADGHQVDIDMGVDWREAEPAVLAIGPVLSLEDAVGNKLSALYSRANARDFLDVDPIRASGKFTDAELIRSANATQASTFRCSSHSSNWCTASFPNRSANRTSAPTSSTGSRTGSTYGRRHCGERSLTSMSAPNAFSASPTLTIRCAEATSLRSSAPRRGRRTTVRRTEPETPG